jgi:hypothetical protein
MTHVDQHAGVSKGEKVHSRKAKSYCAVFPVSKLHAYLLAYARLF